jgi:pimeloyl-ACP methyl ester carboxylesterase
MHSFKADNNKTMIHYYDSMDTSDNQQVPLVVCPGLSETAEEYIDLLEVLLPRRCIILSFRGRGKSDTPDSGYDLDAHVSDIESVVDHAGVHSFHLFGYSRGASYALSYAHSHSNKVISLLLGDYPPEHKAMPSDWPDDYINNYLIPYNRTANIRPKAVYGIQKESLQISLASPPDIPVFVARGLLEGSLVTEIDLERYKRMSSDLSIKEYQHSDHGLKGKDKEAFYGDIRRFLEASEKKGGRKR